jgi:hypothetical protein
VPKLFPDGFWCRKSRTDGRLLDSFVDTSSL